MFKIALFSFLVANVSQSQPICSVPGTHVGLVRAEFLQKPIDLKTGIGAESLNISKDGQLQHTTDVVLAYYKQALAFLYVFNYVDSIRSMNMALQLNPYFAMGYVVLVRAYLNIGGLEPAQLALKKAQVLAAAGALDRVETAWIDVATELVKSHAQPAARNNLIQANSRLLTWGAGDAEVLAYDATTTFDEQKMKEILNINPQHIGAHHYLTHLYEDQGQYERAQAHARASLQTAGQSWHIVHMLGHSLPMVGKWKEAERQFEESDKLSRAWMQAEQAALEDDWHYAHNLELYGFVENKLGNFKKAEQLFKDKCEVKPADANCVSLVDFYLTQRRYKDAMQVFQNKLYDVILAPAFYQPSRTSITIRAFYGETLMGLGETARGEAFAKDLHFEKEFTPRIAALKLAIEFKRPVSLVRQNEIAESIESALAGHSFDTWSIQLLSVQRIARAAKARRFNNLAQRIAASIRRIDADFKL